MLERERSDMAAKIEERTEGVCLAEHGVVNDEEIVGLGQRLEAGVTEGVEAALFPDDTHARVELFETLCRGHQRG
jgi:hypothetical protein